MVMELTTAQIQAFVVNGTMAIFILIIGSIVLRRNPKNRLNRSFFLFYIFIAFGLFINVAYRLINRESWMVWMNRITVFFSISAIIFLLIFNMIIYHSEQVFTRKKALISTILWFIICSGFLWIDLDNGVQWDFNPICPGIQSLIINPGAAGVPAWSTIYTIYGMILAQSLFIVIIIIAVRIIRKFGDIKLRRRYVSSIIAIFMFDWILVGNMLNNWTVMQNANAYYNLYGFTPFSTIFLYTSVLVIPAVLLLWYSVRKKD